MSKLYKVWLEIEEIDHEEDHYEDVGEAIDLAVFGTLEEAEAFAQTVEENHRAP
jgi:hypothetical protein